MRCHAIFGYEAITAENFITNLFEAGIFRIVNADKDNAFLIQQLLQQPQPRIHHTQPFVMTGEILSFFADYLPQPLTNAGIIHVVVVNPPLIAGIVGRINVPADFDTKRKAFSGSKAPKKA